MMTRMLFAAAVALGMIVLCALVLKIHSKYRNARIICKIDRDKFTFDELNELYHREVSRIKIGSNFILALIAVFVFADAFNYYDSFNSIFRTQSYILIILVLTLAIVLDHTPTTIAEYVFSGEELRDMPEKNRKIMKAITILLIAVIVAFIVMLFAMRWSTTDIVFSDSDANEAARKAMVVLWSLLPVGTSLGAVLYATVNKLLLTPRMLKALNNETAVLGEALFGHLESQRVELQKYIDSEKSETELTHIANVKKIKTEHDLLVATYKSRPAPRASADNNDSQTIRQAI